MTRPVRRARDQAESQGVAIHIGGDDVAAQSGVLVGSEATVVSHRGVVHRVHGDARRGDVRVRCAIVGLEGEAIRPVVVRRRRVRERPGRAERDRPVAGPATRRKVRASPSTSVAVTFPVRAVSSAVVKLPLLATGASFTERTVKETVAVFVPPCPS